MQSQRLPFARCPEVGFSIALALSGCIATTGAFVVNEQTRRAVQPAICLRCRGVGAHQCRICMGCGKLPSARGMRQLLRREHEEVEGRRRRRRTAGVEDVDFLQVISNHEQDMDIFMKELDEQEPMFEELMYGEWSGASRFLCRYASRSPPCLVLSLRQSTHPLWMTASWRSLPRSRTSRTAVSRTGCKAISTWESRRKSATFAREREWSRAGCAGGGGS